MLHVVCFMLHVEFVCCFRMSLKKTFYSSTCSLLSGSSHCNSVKSVTLLPRFVLIINIDVFKLPDVVVHWNSEMICVVCSCFSAS